MFAKFRFFGKGFLFVLILSSLMVPFQVVVVPLYLIIRDINLFNTLVGVIVPNLVSAFGIYLMRQFIEGLPSALIEAGRIDGASEFGIYWRIIIPQVVPALTALGIFTFKWMWNDYLWPLVAINDQAHETLALGMAAVRGGAARHPLRPDAGRGHALGDPHLDPVRDLPAPVRGRHLALRAQGLARIRCSCGLALKDHGRARRLKALCRGSPRPFSAGRTRWDRRLPAGCACQQGSAASAGGPRTHVSV